MDVTNTYTLNPTTLPTTNDVVSNPDGILGKDDFMKLLLTELQYQDPTSPMDSDKILSQTSQLATLEASDNTNKALDNLTSILTQSASLSVVSTIGKMALLNQDTFMLNEKGDANVDIYLPTDISSGTLQILDKDGNVVRTIAVDAISAGNQTFFWNGTDDAGDRLEAGAYHAKLDYTASDGSSGVTQTGAYRIESVRFENGETLLKVGSHYVSMNDVSEIYGG